MNNTQIIILAGGKGTRMKSDQPKALTLLKGKPFLLYILDTVNSLHLSLSPVIVVGHKKEKIKEVLGEGYVYAEQNEPLGTGHAVSSARESMDPRHKTVVVLSSDEPLVSKETIMQLLSKHEEKKSIVTIATMVVPDFEEWRTGLRHFGRIIHDQNGAIKGIIEFKDANEKEKMIKELNPAVYAFDSEWLWQNIGLIKNDNAKGEYYLTDLIKIAVEEGKKIESVPLFSLKEGLQPNTKEEVSILEKLAV